MTTSTHETAERIVSQEVRYCVSHLISQLASNDHAARTLGVDVEEDLYPVLAQDDFEEPARDWFGNAHLEDLRSVADYYDLTSEAEGLEAPALRAMLLEYLGEEDKWQDLCDFQRLDPHQIEAYEHWIVSDWFAGKLEAKGEMVSRDILGLTVWGRTTTGQSISMDGVIQAIAADLENL